jgi:hypothetical protein
LDAATLVDQVKRVRGVSDVCFPSGIAYTEEKLVPETVFDDECAFDIGEV